MLILTPLITILIHPVLSYTMTALSMWYLPTYLPTLKCGFGWFPIFTYARMSILMALVIHTGVNVSLFLPINMVLIFI